MQRKYDKLPENISDIKSEANLAKWIPIVTECCNSGQSKKAWCEERGIDVKSYFYYQKRVYNLIKKPAAEFVELVPVEEPKPVETPNSVAARIIIDGIVVELCNGIDSQTVSTIVRGLKNV